VKTLHVKRNPLEDRVGSSVLVDVRERREPDERPTLVAAHAAPALAVAKRPRSRYRVTKPYGPYVRGQIIEPTGIYRDQLLARGLIVRVED